MNRVMWIADAGYFNWPVLPTSPTGSVAEREVEENALLRRADHASSTRQVIVEPCSWALADMNKSAALDTTVRLPSQSISLATPKQAQLVCTNIKCARSIKKEHPVDPIG